jgi:hypothetical protein
LNRFSKLPFTRTRFLQLSGPAKRAGIQKSSLIRPSSVSATQAMRKFWHRTAYARPPSLIVAADEVIE